MSIYIFSGPTLRPKEGREELDAIYLPPASQGDVYRVALKKPFAIGIIDGYFDRMPAVWHKEILWAMAEGIHVFGAASMGALRAAELAAFGMEGVGRIYEAFRDGIFEDDDEVAVVHSVRYMPLSEAMVNIRYTLEKAEMQGVVNSSTRSTLERMAKGLFYPERTYDALFEQARQLGVLSNEISRFEQWLPNGRVDQKRDDALAMLRALRFKAENDPTPKKADYYFERTYVWEQLRYQAGELRINSSSTQTVFTDSVLEELRLEGNSYIVATERCLMRLLALERVGLQNDEIDDASFLETIVEFRERHGLQSAENIRKWLREFQLTQEEFIEFMYEEAKLHLAKSTLAEQIERLLPTYLRLTGQFPRLADRSVQKHRILSKMGLENPTSNDAGMDDSRLLEWYFRDRFNQAPPNNLVRFARGLGFHDEGDMLRAIRREKCYLMHMGERSQHGDKAQKGDRCRRRAGRPGKRL